MTTIAHGIKNQLSMFQLILILMSLDLILI